MALHQQSENHNWHSGDDRQGGRFALKGRLRAEIAGQRHRQRDDLDAGQDQGKEKFVPGKDNGENRRGDQTLESRVVM